MVQKASARSGRSATAGGRPPSKRPGGGIAKLPRSSWANAYREKWRWDSVAWGTHCVDCPPGNCPFRVYVKDGAVLREEQAGAQSVVETGVPDMNPMGCQKGAAWSQMLSAKERVLHPLKRAGERGEGKWQRVSWDDALTEIADGVIDAIREAGPQSILEFSSALQGGMMVTFPFGRFMGLLGCVRTDSNADIGDFNTGLFETFGQAASCGSADDGFHSDLILIWHSNPVYTNIPCYHVVPESRYGGAEVVTIAPDASPSTVHADYYVPVKPGGDSALALAMCQVIIEEGLYNASFVKEQTDLPLLVRTDTRRFLRQSDVESEGSDEQFYIFDTRTGAPAEAPRATLSLDGAEPALEGRFQVALADGAVVEVAPVFEFLKERLKDYEPARVSQLSGTNPGYIRELARKVAGRRTKVLLGFSAAKYYHGDLIERSISLVLALTGNWGRKGTGLGNPVTGLFNGAFLFPRKQEAGPEEVSKILGLRSAVLGALQAQDPTLSDEMATIDLMARGAPGDPTGPSALFWYHHTGHRERWNREEWSDPAMSRSLDDYVGEAMEKGWWQGLERPTPGTAPLVAFEVGGNTLRKTRGGRTLLLKHLWPKLRMMVTMDWRMTGTGLYSDFVLPVASHYEKIGFFAPFQSMPQLTLSDQAVPPAGETKPEWEIVGLLAKKLEARAKALGFLEYTDAGGAAHRLDNLYESLTLGGQLADPERLADEIVRDTAVSGVIPKGTTLKSLRRSGFVRFTDWGVTPFDAAQASDFPADETHAALRWHVERGIPYPTLTRRAQFYIDHDWFLEAGEELPVHKDSPKMGGDYPFAMTGGHNRWSIHSANITNRVMLNTHRGRPHLMVNTTDAAARGISDGEDVRVQNDVGEFVVPAKVAPTVRPGQVIIYNGWDIPQFAGWKGPMDLEPGMVKWLHFAGGYGHLRYWTAQWQPVPFDRGTRVDVQRAK